MGTAFPELPFNGQIFIDAFRMRWIFDSEQKCWVRSGSVRNLPVASELQPGLLSAKLKQILDSLPEKAGSFGIITKPLLSLSQNKPKAIIRDKVAGVFLDDSGTTLEGLIPSEGRSYAVEQFVGKLLRFKTGLLCDKVFLIFTNDADKIFLDGNAIKAEIGDEFEILEPSRYNPSGVLLGDIVLVSESIDITCVDSNGEPLPEGCNVNKIFADDPDNPPALNFRLNENFLNNLCVTIPGCQGARGDKGDKGDKGAPGTGDGPAGDQGDPGLDAPTIGENFDGIKLVELDDIFDTAVVGLELDAVNGILGVVKAKVRTPGNDNPADQVVSTPISRSINFTDKDSFQYEIFMPPTGDPVGDPDIAIVKYPRRYTPESNDKETTVSKVMLSDLIDRVITYYESKLSEINDDYNQVIKDYINGKDAEARTILANLADELARCEFELPIDFCLGISPSDCNPLSTANGGSLTTSTAGGFPYPLAATFFSVTGIPQATDMGILNVIPSSIDQVLTEVNITHPSVNADLGQVTLPTGGYIIQWISGTVKSSSTGYLVGSGVGVGLEAEVVDGMAAPVIFEMPVPSAPFNSNDSSSVELAYQEAPIIEKAMPIEITDAAGGTIKLRAPLPGTSASGNLQLRVIRVDLA